MALPNNPSRTAQPGGPPHRCLTMLCVVSFSARTSRAFRFSPDRHCPSTLDCLWLRDSVLALRQTQEILLSHHDPSDPRPRRRVLGRCHVLTPSPLPGTTLPLCRCHEQRPCWDGWSAGSAKKRGGYIEQYIKGATGPW